MAGHNLMQAIARVNRVFGDKQGGLVVDYVGIASALKQAMNDYTIRDRKNYGDTDISKTAYPEFQKKLEVCHDLLHGYDYSGFYGESAMARATSISGGVDFLQAPERATIKQLYIKEALILRQSLSLCACEYTSHGHCGIIRETAGGFELDNDASLLLMQKIAVSQAAAGADMVAPSCMLDGMVSAIRDALDDAGYSNIPIMSYSTKFASALYGPFREAADSGFAFGDRKTYQMNPANAREAFRESELDAAEGADILMVKPATFYLDVLADIRSLGLPVAAYHVSGEYAMIKAAAANGWIDEKAVVLEAMTSLRRAGADLIITYYTRDILRWLNE